MARKLRLQYPGAVYHVMSRGDRREAIFRDDKDRWRFLDTLAEACGRSGMLVHSYVLMPNHYHLLVETPEGNLVDGMRWLQGTYTARFNARHGIDGHLFQGRYKAIPVDPDEPEYFRTASDYIHLNPARSHLLDAKNPRLGTYRWSSYGPFVAATPLPPWLIRRRVFAAHGLAEETVVDRRRYAALLARRLAEVPGKPEPSNGDAWALVRQGPVLGGEAFREKVQRLVEPALQGRRRSSFVGDETIRRHDQEEASRLLARIKSVWGDVDDPARPAKDARKQAAAWLLRSRTTAGGAWIAGQLAMRHVSNVSRAYLAVLGADAEDELGRLRDEVMRICKD